MRRYLEKHLHSRKTQLKPVIPSVLQPYEYEQLPPPTEGQGPSIRVLFLRPVEHEHSPLMASLRQFPLDDIEGNYEALSYTWGSNQFTELLIIDGHALKITKNLHGALSRLRMEKTRRLWVDAVCINQEDLKERTAQVSIMAQVYACSQQTLVWLGEPRKQQNSEAVVDFLRRQAPRCRALPADQTLQFDDLCSVVAESQLAENLPQVTSYHLDRFLNLVYFSRRWIIQEILLSRKAEVVWGPHILSWEDLHICVQKMTTVGQAEHARLGAMAFKDTTRDFLLPGGSNILALMYRFQRYECQDPRDQIAALKGLWHGHADSMEAFTIDYAESVESNYLRFAAAIAQTPDCGELLVCAGLRNTSLSEKGKPLKAPSWVPDWRHDPFTTMPTDCYLAYQAHLVADNTLVLRGWIVDTVTRANRSKDAINQLKADPVKYQEELRLLDAKPDRYRRRLECLSGPDRSLTYNRFLHNEVVQSGDSICVFARASILRVTQFVIRKITPGPDRYHLIGTCEWDSTVKEPFADKEEWDLPQDPCEICLV